MCIAYRMPVLILSCHLAVSQSWDDKVFGIRAFTLEQHRVVQWVAKRNTHLTGTVEGKNGSH